MTTTTTKVRTAIEHVRQLHPEVTRVYFDVMGRWRYTDAQKHGPAFTNVDVGLLEDASDSLAKLPITFDYDPATRRITEIAETVEDVEDLDHQTEKE
jgi:hypothetical protein